MGVDPFLFIDVTDEEYLIRAAMLRKAIELRTEEIQATAKLIGIEIASSL